MGNAYLQYDLTREKDIVVAADRFLVDGDAIRLVNNFFAQCFEKTRLSTMRSSDIEHNKYVGQISTIMRALTSEDADLLSHFDKVDQSQAQIEDTSLKHLLFKNHDEAAKKSKIK